MAAKCLGAKKSLNKNRTKMSGEPSPQDLEKEKVYGKSAAENGVMLNKDKQEITPQVEEAAAEADSLAEDKEKDSEDRENVNEAQSPDAREDTELMDKIRALSESLYPESENPLNDLIKRLEGENAQSRGMRVEDYRQREEDRRDAEEYRRLRKRQRDYEDGRQKILNRWMRDTERLKRDVPDFDLDEAMKNDEFRELVVNGMSVDGAYYAVKYREQNGTPSRRSIMQNASSRGMRSGSSINDLTILDDKAFKRELKKMMN